MGLLDNEAILDLGLFVEQLLVHGNLATVLGAVPDNATLELDVDVAVAFVVCIAAHATERLDKNPLAEHFLANKNVYPSSASVIVASEHA